MEFFEASNMMLALTKDLPHIKLELLNVYDSELRNKGIASLYIRKLQKYAIDNGFKYIMVKVTPYGDIFKEQSMENSLNIKDLKEFYRRKSLGEMPIKLLGE